MTVYVFPAGRVISSDGTVLGPSTNVGDILYLTATGALSVRAQNAAGAPVDVAIPSIGGGSGTTNRVVKFTATGVMDDSAASDTGSVFQIGQGLQWRFVADYANGSGWQFLDAAGVTVASVGPTGKVTANGDITTTAGAFIASALAGAAGSLQVNAFGLVEKQIDATTSPYTPAAPINWAGAAPTNVEAALDRIAAAVAGLLLGPIP